MTLRARFATVMVGTSMLVVGSAAANGVTDHLKCYKVRDAQKLKALVDLATPQLGAETGCKVSSRSVERCVPAVKTVQEAEVNGQPIVPAPGSGPAAAGDYVCYKLACPKEERPPADTAVGIADQFGNRAVSRLRPARLCTPAAKVETSCGPTQCAPDLVCCNPVLGICALPGQVCVQS